MENVKASEAGTDEKSEPGHAEASPQDEAK